MDHPSDKLAKNRLSNTSGSALDDQRLVEVAGLNGELFRFFAKLKT